MGRWKKGGNVSKKLSYVKHYELLDANMALKVQ